MKAGGIGIIPLPPRAAHGPAHLLPNTRIVLWSYTDLSDPRWTLGETTIQLNQAGVSKQFMEQKIGIFDLNAWIAYHNAGHLFIKSAQWNRSGEYPDLGCNLEMFANPQFLELETLGPIQHLETAATAVHVENWLLLRDLAAGKGDAWFGEVILPKVLHNFR